MSEVTRAISRIDLANAPLSIASRSRQKA